MKTQNDFLQYDKRVMHRFVAEGKLTAEKAQEYLAALPDLADQCEDIANEIYSDLPENREKNKLKQGF